MKAKVVTMNGCAEYDVEELGKFFTIVGYTEDLTEARNKGAWVHCKELDNQPIIKGFLSPMYDGGKLRYETQEVYDILSI